MALKIRGTLNVLGERYEVSTTRRLPKNCWGRCYADGKIQIHPDQSKDKARDTLLHELIHAVDNVDALKLSEHQVRRISTGLRTAFRSNPGFARFISG